MTIANKVENREIEGGRRVKKLRQSLFDFLKGKNNKEQETVMGEIIAGRAKIGELNSKKRIGYFPVIMCTVIYIYNCLVSSNECGVFFFNLAEGKDCNLC